MQRLYTQTEFIDVLRSYVQVVGTQKALAAHLKVSEQYLSDVLAGRKEPGPKLCAAFGYERVIHYRAIEKAEN